MWEIVVAVFTVVLAVTTIVYVVVSMKLLKQSMKLLKQSRNAFLADIGMRLMEICRKGIIEKKPGKGAETVAFTQTWREGYVQLFTTIEKELGIEIAKLVDICRTAILEEWGKGTEISDKWKEESERLYKRGPTKDKT